MANNLSLYEKIKINENMVAATYYDLFNRTTPNEVVNNKWKDKMDHITNIPFLRATIDSIVKGSGKNSTWLLIGNSHAMAITRHMEREFINDYSYFYKFYTTSEIFTY
uniref:Uncharacterized protein n=1 Tax=Meloidogyne hapla TaxID=6305 RepID=A0A1I8C2J6_MELHA